MKTTHARSYTRVRITPTAGQAAWQEPVKRLGRRTKTAASKAKNDQDAFDQWRSIATTGAD